MSNTGSPFIVGLVEDEVRRFIAEAIARGGTISTSECVAKIRIVYPTCGLSRRTISDMVIAAASTSGVPVAIGALASDQQAD
jgi:hypothetical protein